MELILINADKMKIVLTKNDMEQYGIHIDFQLFTLGRAGSVIREAFSDVLDEVKYETGFDALGAHSIIQVYPARDGGCELYITKFDRGGDDTVNEAARTEKRESCARAKKTMVHSVFAFDSPIDLIDACTMLASTYNGCGSRLYRSDDRYYLMLEHESPAAAPPIFTRLCDFGYEVTDRYLEAYLEEHGSCLIESSVIEKLGRGSR